jgi:hypothetical protein
MAGASNQELRTFENQLALRVKAQHGSRCPCCGHPMVQPRRDNNMTKRRRDRQTVAHNQPVTFGGDATIWVYACNGCNGDQKGLTFRAWSRGLARAEDPRAAAVAALADTIDEFLKERARAKFSQPSRSVSATA